MDEPVDNQRHTAKETAKNLLAGGLGAMLARAVCQPLDVTKVRFQVYPNRYKSTVHAITEIYKEHGLKGLWRGHTVAQTSGLFQGAIQFFLYEQLNYSLRNTSLESTPNVKNFVCGFITGTIGVLLISPFELVKTRLMAQDKNMKNEGGAFKTAIGLLRRYGIRGVYKGSFTATLQVGPLVGSRFMMYNFVCNLAMELTKSQSKGELSAPILLLAGGGSGIVSNAMTYPVDVVKRRMQVHGFEGGLVSSCNKIAACVSKTINEDGPRGLYKGMSPTLLKSAVTTSLTFSAFDKIKAVLNHLDEKTS